MTIWYSESFPEFVHAGGRLKDAKSRNIAGGSESFRPDFIG